ncbi:hypothetical protein RhiirA5_468496 [Rhizophagus irregularis]|uniref:CRIB domain-containing protein n=3 Tax=Rhizophagus irregularis TaxID=588596 RepID=U9TIT1_RHIID|nr:hypothetical protein GLOIN_2v1762899 [Rhizophagus irregularis DAOM 181602=DAOM 197198]EXX72145.1 hypothetical protein RirG_072160 [Rhizophagus irregularis DAOM 197198w]PKC11193.1 hypothetical protein RhiirA5_468496 [Rhizophagus irregularis]PKC74050.1 hypothetical protein RhiirA1_450432 [Rhizophagus irregularis]PKY17736.1 hypothetical protein RhiirB3_382761 [Rhizophagus irregularis]PKY45928.1 hypothetical protein RhiirA4_179160 [Rhizophagus irregularis]|eukprot:XP_025188528.1 hypothetical protein GLOIN_2v1762899 [Rhizophagus irregularis DAOM 181602=DAOM 197198]
MGGCISSSSQKQAKLDVGISSATYSQTINKKPVNNRFHENDNVNGSPTNNNAKKAKVVKKQKKKIHKGLIGLPSNFQHTGHIGITELRSGKVDPEKIKNQMAEVAAALSLEGLNIGSTIPSANDTNTNNNDIKNHETPTLTSISSEQQIVTDNNNNINNNNDNNNRPISLQNESLFKVKRKPTLTPISSPVQQQRQLPSSTLNPVVDPMTEIVAALKMPIDGNFDQKLVV